MFGFAWRKCGGSRLVALPIIAFALALAMMFAPVSHAASRPSSAIPNYNPCQLTVWSTLHTDTFTHGANGATYTIKDNLQETYDNSFRVWCQHYRNDLLLSANSSNPGGTIISYVGPCAGNFNGSTYSFGKGSINNAEYPSPTIYVSPGAAQDADGLLAAGQNWADKGTCDGN